MAHPGKQARARQWWASGPWRAAALTVTALILAGGSPSPSAALEAPGGPAARPAADGASSPIGVAEAYFAAMRRNDFDGVVQLMHPEALRRFHQILLPVVGKMLRQGQASTPINSPFADIQSDAQLNALTSEEFFQRFLKQLWSSEPDFQRALAASTITPVGQVPEGDAQAHVVFRSAFTVDGATISKVDVLSLKRMPEGSWRVLLSSDLEGVANMFQRLGPKLESTDADGAPDPDDASSGATGQRRTR